ncbi:ribonuclease H-like domain-containing protein, partial [Tanacetum coccineum]
GNPQLELQEKGVIDSGCSRHMTGNKSYLSDYKEIDGGFVSFRGDPKGGKITSKGKISTGKLDFEDVYFVKEIKFNLFSILQMCDKKNSVLFTDTKCVVLYPDFKLLDENHVLLRVPRKDNMYSVDLKNIVPSVDIENLIDLKVKVIRCENEAEFKNKIMNQFCEINGKFDGKADGGFFVGCSVNNKAFRVFNSRTRIVEENLHITFLENKPNVAGSRPKWLFDIDTLTISMNYKPGVAGNQTNGSPGSKDSLDAGFKPSGEEEKKDFKDPRNEDSEVPSIKEPRVNQEKDANFNSTNNINTASDGNNTNNVNTISSTVNATGINDNAVHENIFYGCDDDPNMPNLEEIAYSDDDENVGTEADMNNLNTFMPVSPILTTRLHKDHLLKQIIGDIHSAPQTGRMTKSVWTLVDLPHGKRAIGTKWVYRNKKDERGIVIRNKPRLVAQGYTQEYVIDYDEVFAPVARIEVIRLFLAYALFKDFVVYQMDVKSAFLYGKIEEEVYVYQPSGFEDPEFTDRVYKVKQKDNGIFISQDKYVADILKKFDFAPVKTTSIPMETNKALLKDEDSADVGVHLYRSMIGSLMYLTASRPDIMFVVCAYSPFDLEAFSDSDYAGDSLDRKSTTGGESSRPIPLITYETVIKEWEDRMEKAATTASSLVVEQDSGNINKTQSMATLNESFP